MSALQRVMDPPEHVGRVECSQPVAVGVGIIVAGSSAMALDEGNLPEVLQAGTRRGQRLAWTLCPYPCLLCTHVSPEPPWQPILATCWNTIHSPWRRSNPARGGATRQGSLAPGWSDYAGLRRWPGPRTLSTCTRRDLGHWPTMTALFVYVSVRDSIPYLLM